MYIIYYFISSIIYLLWSLFLATNGVINVILMSTDIVIIILLNICAVDLDFPFIAIFIVSTINISLGSIFSICDFHLRLLQSVII